MNTQTDFIRMSHKQAAHDIRSPLTALKALLATSETSGDQAHLIQSVINRIEQIANDLSKNANTAPDLESLGLGLKSLINEKRWEHPYTQLNLKMDRQIENQPFKTKEIKRVISNLINNSVQAGAQNISIEIKQKESKLTLELSDDGMGMPDDVVASINAGLSLRSSKFEGHGLGLRHARIFAMEGKGFLKVFSRKGRGTRVRIENLSCPD